VLFGIALILEGKQKLTLFFLSSFALFFRLKKCIVFQFITLPGGLKHYAEISAQKSKTLYDIIDNSAGFYSCKIEKDSRSRMNVTFKYVILELISLS
jgi:phosphoserine aminotransferase